MPEEHWVFMTQVVKQPSFPDFLFLAFLLAPGGCGRREEITRTCRNKVDIYVRYNMMTTEILLNGPSHNIIDSQ